MAQVSAYIVFVHALYILQNLCPPYVRHARHLYCLFNYLSVGCLEDCQATLILFDFSSVHFLFFAKIYIFRFGLQRQHQRFCQGHVCHAGSGPDRIGECVHGRH